MWGGMNIEARLWIAHKCETEFSGSVSESRTTVLSCVMYARY